MEIKVIDFNGRFRKDYLEWCSKHQDIAADEEKLDSLFLDMYEAWFTRPKKWLDGQSPNQYFEKIQDPAMYATLFIEYIKMDLELPEPLVQCLLEEKEQIYPTLLNILSARSSEDMSAEQFGNVQAHCVALIREMQLEHPIAVYIRILRDTEEDCLLLEEITETLEDYVKTQKDALLDAYKTAKGAGRDAILDLISQLEGEAEIFAILLEEFEAAEGDRRCMLATCLGRFGDARALDALEDAAAQPDIDYYAYRTYREAIEELGGEEEEDRDFSGDPLYEFLASQLPEEEE